MQQDRSIRLVRSRDFPVQNHLQKTHCLASFSEDITEHKQAEQILNQQETEEAMRASQERFRSVFESAPIGMAIADATGRWIQTNPVVQEMLGYTGEELQNLPFMELTHPDDQAESFKLFQELLAGKRTHVSLEKRYFRKDGRLIWVNLSATAGCDANGLPQYAIAILQDISAQKQANSDLQKALDELEKRITKRTTELEQANTHLKQEIAERKQAQEELKAQHEFLQNIIDTNPNIIYVKDREDKYVLANKVFADCHGRNVEDLLGLTTAELHPNQAQAEMFRAQDQEVIATLQQKFIPEEAGHTPTGEVRWYQTIKTPLFSKDGKVCQVLGVSTDITQRRLAEEALKAQHELLQTVLDSNPNMIFVKDREGKYVLVNQVFADFYGVTVEEAIGKTAAELNSNQADVERFIAQDQEVLTTLQQKFIPEEAYCTPTGEVRWYQTIKKPLSSTDGQVCQVFGVCSDITQRKLAEVQRRQSEAQLRRLFEANLIGVIFADFSGNITEANDTFLKMVGYTREELLAGKVRWADMTPPEYDEDDAQAREQIRLTGVCTPHEKEYIRKDGNRVPILTGSALLQGSDQDCVSFVLDLTWRKLAEAKIKESLREKEVLLKEIHHRVKNNLQVISSLLDLQSQHIQGQATLELFQESQNRVRAMALVHEKLYQSKDYASINFAEYIENLTSDLFQVYGMNAGNITLDLDIDEVSLNIDTAIPCGLIITELVSNALKYAFPNSRKGKITVVLNKGLDKSFTLIVKDNGVGFPVNFDFNSVKSLGLQLVKVLTNQLDGLLKINHGIGTEVIISFSEMSY